MRSRTTLASTDAAATDAHLASPSTMGRTSPPKGSSGWRSRSTGPSTRIASGGCAEPGEGPARRHPERLGHPPLVALGGRGMPDRPLLAPRADGVEDLLASGLAQHLGVPQPLGHGPALDAGSHHGDADGERAGPGAAPDLVEARHTLVALGAQAALLLEIGRADGHGITAAARLIPWGCERRRGGCTRSECTVPACPGDQGRRAQPLPGHVGARLRDRRGRPRTGTASAGCRTAARWASSSPGTTSAGSGRARASGGTEGVSPSPP